MHQAHEICQLMRSVCKPVTAGRDDSDTWVCGQHTLSASSSLNRLSDNHNAHAATQPAISAGRNAYL